MKILNQLISLKYFSLLIKTLVLFVLFSLIYIGFSAHATEAGFLKQLRNFNLANLIVWSYWWPFLVVSSIIFGRIWCMICPIEMITSFASLIGLKKERPAWLKSGWMMTIFYVLILFVGINGFAIHRSPMYMAIYLSVIVGLSILIGLIYKKNTFCKYVCPIGILLGLYSRFSFLGWRVKANDSCASCKDKSCVSKIDLYRVNEKSCGVDLFPKNIADNSECILCGGCRKVCDKNNSENFSTRPNPGFVKLKLKESLFSKLELTAAELAFTMIISGFVIYEILSEWSVTKSILMFTPKALNNSLAISNHFVAGFLKSVVLFVIFPFIIWTIPYLISKIFKEKISFFQYLKSFAAGFLPIMAAAHLCKAVLKMTSRIPYFEHVFSNIDGLQNTQLFLKGQISMFTLGQQPQLMISVLLILLIGLGIFVSSITIKKLNSTLNIKNKAVMYLIPTVYGFIFLATILQWRFQ